MKAKENTESFGELYDYYFPKVYAYVASKINDRDEAEDLVSEIFIKILQNIKKFEWRGLPFGAWVFRIARNVLNDYYRESGKARIENIDDHREIKDHGDHANPNKKAGQSELQEMVQKVMRNLTETELEIINLKFFSELSNKEIAETLNLSESNVGVMLFRTLKKIKPDLEPAKAIIDPSVYSLILLIISSSIIRNS